MAAYSIRVLLVDDYVPWRRYARLTLLSQGNLQIVGESSDGEQAVHDAQELQPDLILLDIGLPKLSGIEAARRIREVSPTSKILFVAENRSPEVAEEALRTGACGYVVKSDAARELLPAVKTVLEGLRFVSSRLSGDNPVGDNPKDKQAQNQPHVEPFRVGNAEATDSHAITLYSDDAALVDGLTRFIGATLRSGNPVVVLATPSHRTSIVQRLKEEGVDVAVAVKQNRYISLNVADSFATFRLAEYLTAEAVSAANETGLRVGVG